MDDASPRVLIGLPARATSVLGVPVTRLAILATLGLFAIAILAVLGRLWPVGLVLEVAMLVLAGATSWHPLAHVRVWLLRRHRRTRGLVEHQGVLESRGRGSAVLLALEAPIAGMALPGRAEDLGRLLTEAASRARPEDLIMISSLICPEVAFRDPDDLSPTIRALAAHAYRVTTRMAVMSPRCGRRAQAHLRQLALGLESASGRLEAVRVRHLTGPLGAVASGLGRMVDPSLLLGPGRAQPRRAQPGLAESATAVSGPGFAARGFVVAAWPRQAIDPATLGAVLAPVPPARLVALVLGPVAQGQALARVGRHRTEVAADQLLRRERGFLLGTKDAFVEEASHRLEEDLAGGFRLCRHQLVLVVLAPEERLLGRAEHELEVQAARSHLGLRRADGRHRELLEVALAGVRGWS